MNQIHRSLLVVSAALTLAACQGQNPFKRETNPVRDYPKVNDSIEKRQGALPYGTKQTQLPDPDNSQYICTGPFTVSVNTAEGKRLLYFMEDTETKFEITITNRLGDDFQVEHSGLPESASFRLLKKLSENSAVYQVAWRPKIPAGESVIDKTLALSMKSTELSKRCDAMATEEFALLAIKSKERPLASFTGLPQTQIQLGQEVNFTVEVSDRAAAPNNPPFLKAAEFNPQAKNAEKLVIDGSAAVSNCDTVPAFDSNTAKFRFTCTFYSQALGEGAAKKLIGSGKTADAVFFMSVTSPNGRDSNLARATVKIQFPKAASTAANQGAKK